MWKFALALIGVLLSGCATSNIDLNEPVGSVPERKLSLVEAPEALSQFQGHSVFDTLYVTVGYGQSDIESPLDAAVYAPRDVPLELKDRLISQIFAIGLFADVKPTRADTARPINGYFAEISINPKITLPVASKISLYSGLGLIDIQLDTDIQMVAQTRLHRVNGNVKLLEDRYQVTGLVTSSTFKGLSGDGPAGSPNAWSVILDRMTPHIVNVIARGSIVDSVAQAPNRQTTTPPKSAIAPQPVKSLPVRPSAGTSMTSAPSSSPAPPLPALPRLPDLPTLD